MADSDSICIEVVYALPQRQFLERLTVAPTSTARSVLSAVQFITAHPEECAGLNIEDCPLGIFGEVINDQQVLQEGDRVEIYRPLPNDPREQRRMLAARGESMGKKTL